jgi:hypothetical protein
MVQEKLLSATDLAEQLNLGKATAKYLLKRFKSAIPETMIDGQPFYPHTVIQTLFSIQGQLDMGVLPHDIEQSMENQLPHKNETTIEDHLTQLENSVAGSDDIRLSQNGLIMLKTVFNEIGEQQKRIARAHEQRAAAEERKAVAIEKRAEAEEKKAAAMNNIANALQEMNRLRAADPYAQQIAHQAAEIIAADEQNPLPVNESRFDTDIDDINDAFDTDITADDPLMDMDDLLDEAPLDDQLPPVTDMQISDMDDPTALTGTDSDSETAGGLNSETDDLSVLIENNTEDVEGIDDLTDLLDDPLPGELSDSELEEGLIDGPAEKIDDDMLDDLSQLIDPADQQSGGQDDALDNLSALIDQPSADTQAGLTPETGLDDLSALIRPDTDSTPVAADSNEDGSDKQALDDLSALIADTPETQAAASDQETTGSAVPELDDLSALLAPDTGQAPQENDEPEIRIDITPEDNLEKYKAAVMQVIIGLKNDGLSVEQTTEKLNTNKVKTLSGKPEWGLKAISQIYTFIDAAK